MFGAIAVFISLIFLIQIRSLYQGGKIAVLEWDMATITAGDYTIEMEIKPETYENWLKSYDQSKEHATGFALKTELK